MTEHQDIDADWTLLPGGWTAEGLLSQFELRQQWTDGTYWDNCPRLGDKEAD